MDEVIEFLRAFANAENQAKRANFTEPDDKKLVQLVRAFDAMHGGTSLRSGLSRPSGKPPEVFASPDYAEAAARQKPRTVFAVAHYQYDGQDVYRAWMGDTEDGPRGEGLRQNLYVATKDGKLKVVSRYQVCSNCQGAKKVDSGQSCPACDGTGWTFRGGTQWPDLGKPLELRRLQAPTDPLANPAWDAINA